MQRLEENLLWAELVALKDTLSLRELAEKFGTTPGSIAVALRHAGISRRPAPPRQSALNE